MPSAPGVFATGDAARAACDDIGNYALMSCQHATRMGAFAGNNAAAELLGVPTRQYHQKAYVTCLDLGEAGALFTRGWDRKVEMVGAVAKKTKQEINTVWIYPPKAETRRGTRLRRSGACDGSLSATRELHSAQRAQLADRPMTRGDATRRLPPSAPGPQ